MNVYPHMFTIFGFLRLIALVYERVKKNYILFQPMPGWLDESSSTNMYSNSYSVIYICLNL